MSMLRAVSIISILSSTSIFAEDKSTPLPKYQLGIGPVMVIAPDYRGSKNNTTLLLPFPLVIYRGERLVIDNGIDGVLLKKNDFKLSISGSGSPPISNDSSIRQGLQKRSATAEIGPSFEWLLWFPEERDQSIWFELPVRSVFTVDSHFDHVGFNANPRLTWRKPAKYREDWKLAVLTGPLFADSGYHNYFYEVNNSEVIVNRPAYSSASGYSGYRFDFTFSRNYEHYWLGGFIRYDNINNAVFENSPLVETSQGLTAGIALSWIWREG
ncbi:MAG: MipA/OmpV family protein [bacterium]